MGLGWRLLPTCPRTDASPAVPSRPRLLLRPDSLPIRSLPVHSRKSPRQIRLALSQGGRAHEGHHECVIIIVHTTVQLLIEALSPKDLLFVGQNRKRHLRSRQPLTAERHAMNPPSVVQNRTPSTSLASISLHAVWILCSPAALRPRYQQQRPAKPWEVDVQQRSRRARCLLIAEERGRGKRRQARGTAGHRVRPAGYRIGFLSLRFHRKTKALSDERSGPSVRGQAVKTILPSSGGARTASWCGRLGGPWQGPGLGRDRSWTLVRVRGSGLSSSFRNVDGHVPPEALREWAEHMQKYTGRVVLRRDSGEDDT